jgi:hypothetical protein
MQDYYSINTLTPLLYVVPIQMKEHQSKQDQVRTRRRLSAGGPLVIQYSMFVLPLSDHLRSRPLEFVEDVFSTWLLKFTQIKYIRRNLALL